MNRTYDYTTPYDEPPTSSDSDDIAYDILLTLLDFDTMTYPMNRAQRRQLHHTKHRLSSGDVLINDTEHQSN